MLDKQQFIEEEKDCASMLGLTLKEYRKSLKNIKVHDYNKKSDTSRKYDSSIDFCTAIKALALFIVTLPKEASPTPKVSLVFKINYTI